MRLTARFAQRWRCSSVSADHERSAPIVACAAARERFGPHSGDATQQGAQQPLRAEPAYMQGAPSRVLFDREVFEGASPIRSHLIAARPPMPHLQTNPRALVLTVTRAMS